MHQVVELAIGAYQELLEQVFRFRLAPRETKRQPVQAIEMRPDDLFERMFVVVSAYWVSLTNFARSSLNFTSDGSCTYIMWPAS